MLDTNGRDRDRRRRCVTGGSYKKTPKKARGGGGGNIRLRMRCTCSRAATLPPRESWGVERAKLVVRNTFERPIWSAIIKALEALIDEAVRKETTGDCKQGGVAGDTGERSSAEEEGFEA